MTRYLVLPAALLLVGGFLRAAVSAGWDGIALALAGAGVAVAALTALLHRRDVADWLRDPRGVFAVTTGISAAVFVAAMVMVNIAVWYRPWSVDLTASGRNAVSDDTRRLLARLEIPVALKQFGRSPDPALEKLLRSFERESRRVRVEFVDVDREREMTARYGVTRVGTVVVTAGEKFRKIDALNEPSLVTAVLQVTADEQRVVCFATGHGERGIADSGPAGLSRLASALQASAYDVQAVSLLDAGFSATCSVLIVAGAKSDFSPEEMARLDAYHRSGGRVALLTEPDPAPAFAEWLGPRGIEPQVGAVVDTSGAGRQLGGGPRAPLALEYPDHPITRDFGILVLFDGARPLRVHEQPRHGGRASALAKTGPRSFATMQPDAVPAFERSRDAAGPLTLAAAAAVRSGPRDDHQARLAVFGDTDFVSNAYLRLPANRDFFLRTLSWLLGEDEASVVAVDDRENRRIALSERTRAWMYVVNVALLPLIPLFAGVVVYIRSRL